MEPGFSGTSTQTTAVSSQVTISAVQALHDALSGQIAKTTSSTGLGSSPQTSATIHRTLPQIRSQAESSPLSVQSITSATQALASIQQILANRISQSSSMQSSPPHASLTPSLAHLMGEQAVALLNGGASKQTPPAIKSLPVQGTNVSSDTNSAGVQSPVSTGPHGSSTPGLRIAPNTDVLYGLTGSRKRGRQSTDSDDKGKKFKGVPAVPGTAMGSAKSSTNDKLNKGLRHFSWRVCEKVQQKKVTSYNEVADELVREMAETERASLSGAESTVDHKNIRRRVYDALNVLMAMNIISKEKKEIKWIGLPTNSLQECQHLEEQLSQCEKRIQEKTNQLNELIIQVLAFQNLIKRNRESVAENGTPPPNSAITLPFIIINTDKETYIDCSISNDKSEYVFQFDQPFVISDDLDVLKKMGMSFNLDSGSCTPEDVVKAKELLPKPFERFLNDMVSRSQVHGTSSGTSSQQSDISSPFLDKRSLSGPLGVSSVPTPPLSQVMSQGSSIAISPSSGTPPSVGTLGPSSDHATSILTSLAQPLAKTSLSPTGGSSLGKLSYTGLSGSPSPLAKPLYGLGSPLKVAVPSSTTTSPRPGGGGAAKVFVQPVSSPSVKRVQAQVLPNASNLASLVRQGSGLSQSILSVLQNADPQIVSLAQSLLANIGSSPGGSPSAQPSTSIPPQVQQQGIPISMSPVISQTTQQGIPQMTTGLSQSSQADISSSVPLDITKHDIPHLSLPLSNSSIPPSSSTTESFPGTSDLMVVQSTGQNDVV